MKVLQAEFVTSAAAAGRADDVPADGIAQVAFAGRSNVGKSTLLNALAARTLARTSAAPGKTRLANIYRLQVEGGPGGPGRWSVYFVDLPGYGYARGGADSAEELARVAAVYFSTRDSRLATRSSPEHSTSGANEEPNRETPDPASREPRAANREWEPAKRATLLLIDSRHPGLPSDLQAHRWLTAVAGAPQIVATKIDKLSRAERRKNLGEIERVLGSSALPVSAAGGEGLDELWKLIARVAREPRR